MKRILSLGAGVNSTAILCLVKRKQVVCDRAVFADTGGEYPETYLYLREVIEPFCDSMNLDLDIVKSGKPPLREFYLSKRIIPTRMFRHCTDHYKIQPLRKYCREQYPNDQVTFLIGIDSGERQRAAKFCSLDGVEFPLIELGLDREACKTIIREEGLPVPHKSGCYFCPFTRKEGWLDLLRNHRDLFLLAEELEQNNQRYPEMRLTNVPLEKVRKSKDAQQSLCNFVSDCGFCEVSA